MEVISFVMTVKCSCYSILLFRALGAVVVDLRIESKEAEPLVCDSHEY
jgi:hypothetical protein